LVVIRRAQSIVTDEVISMRRYLLATCLVVSMAMSAAAVSLCDYQSPLTDLSALDLGFYYRYYRDPFGFEDQHINQGTFLIDYLRLFDAPEYGFDIAFQNELRVNILDADDSTYTLRADGNYKRYVQFETDSFAFAGAQVRSASGSQGIALSLSLGVGTGRFTDVTPMAKAVRIEEVLAQRGALQNEEDKQPRELHPVDLQEVAAAIRNAATYETQAELLARIQTILESSGVVRLGGLDAQDMFEVTRVLQSGGMTRYCGWDLKAGLGYELLSPSDEENDLLVMGAFNFALASTPREQILFTGLFSGAVDVINRHQLDINASYDYVIFDFLSARAAYAFIRETWGGNPNHTHRIAVDLLMQPADIASVILSLVMQSEEHYTLGWSIDLKLSIEMSVL